MNQSCCCCNFMVTVSLKRRIKTSYYNRLFFKAHINRRQKKLNRPKALRNQSIIFKSIKQTLTLIPVSCTSITAFPFQSEIYADWVSQTKTHCASEYLYSITPRKVILCTASFRWINEGLPEHKWIRNPLKEAFGIILPSERHCRMEYQIFHF